MINNYGDTGSGFGGHGQPSAPLQRSMEHSKQQNVGPGWSYNTQLEGLYSCYPSEPQPMYNIHSMGHFESSGKHNNNHYPQYPTGAMHQPVPTPVVKCHEACCQNLSDHSRYPVNPAPLRYPPTVSVQPPRYGDITNSEHRQYFQDRRGLQSSVTRKKEFQADGGFTGVHHNRHFSQCVGRGQLHVPENRQSMQVVRSQYPMYPINSYWSPRSWTGPRVNYPPPPPYHQSVSSQSAQLQSGLKMPDPPHYIEPSMQKQLGNQQRRAAIRNGNGTTEVVRPVPENKRPAIEGNHIQSCYDFPYTSGFVPFNDVSKITSNSISQLSNTSCKISTDKQFQHQMQYAVQSNDRTVSGCNDPIGDISYSMNFSIPNSESYMRQPVEGSEQIPATRKLAVQYEQPPVGKKRTDLDVRQFLATWEDDEEDSARMSEPLTNNNNGPPYIVVDYRSLDNESSSKTQERLKPSGGQVCSSKSQNSSPGLDNKRQTSEDVNSREKESQRSVIHSEYLSQNSFLQPTAPTIHNDVEKNINFWGPNTRENCSVNEGLMNKSVFQPLDCSKRDPLNIVEPIMPSKRDSHIHGDMSNHKMMSSDSNHISFDALVTYYGDSRRGSDGSYDLVEMTERLVNATDKICTSERSPLEQQLPPDIIGCNEMRVHHQSQIGVNPNSFHNRMPPHYAGNTFQHFKQSISTDGFFNLKQPVSHSKYYSIDQPQMMDQGNFEFHKGPTEFGNQRTYDAKDNTSTTKIQEGGRKACQQDNKKALYNESLRNSEVGSSTHSHDKENLEFVGVDPEQFITPIIIKKSDYQSKDCDKNKDATKEKNSRTEVEVISEKSLFSTGSERTVLISNDMGTEVFKVPYSPDKKQFLQKDNVVTLHSGDNTKCNTVTVEVPYVQQYSNLVKLSEEMTQADNIPDNKNCTADEIQYNTGNNNCDLSTDIKNKTDESKRTASLKLKRLPNSQEWIKIDEKIKLSENNDCVSQRNEKHNLKDAISDNTENSPTRVINLNMPSLDDNENSSHIENAPETQKVATADGRGPNYPSRSRHNDSINPDNMSIPQLAIVSPLKFVSDNKEESNTSVQNNKLKKDNYFQTDKQFFNNSTNSQNYEDAPQTNNNCLQHEIENQFQQVHSPYNTLYLSQKQTLVQSGHSSSMKNFSDIQYLSENGNEKHENFKQQKKIQRVESLQQTTSTDVCENSQQMLKNKNNNREQFSAFYSGQDISSHMSPFNLSTRLLTNEKDLDHHIPTSPGVDEMFEDINNPGHDSLFQNKTDNLPELTENSSFTLTSSCQSGNSFDSFFEHGASDGNRPCENIKRPLERITLNKTPDDERPNCSIIIKKNAVDSSSCENLPGENEELPLTNKVNSPKSENRETCQEENVPNGIVPVERSTDFATLNSSERVSSGEKDFINDSFHGFEYVHTSVLQELNDTTTDSSTEVEIDTNKRKEKNTNLPNENETKLHIENKCEYSLINSNSNVGSALRVSGKQEHINCNSDKVSENSKLKENEISVSDESSTDIKCSTKLVPLDNMLSMESDENIKANQHVNTEGKYLKSSHICDCSPENICENIKQDSEIIQSVVSGVLKTVGDCEDINLCGKFNTIEYKCEGIENGAEDTNNLKQVCNELNESDKSDNKCEKLSVDLCKENDILSEKCQSKVVEKIVKHTEDSVSSHKSVVNNQNNLTDNVHRDYNENSQIITETNKNCTSMNDMHSLHLANQTIQNEEKSNLEMLRLTVDKFEVSCNERMHTTNCAENIVDIDNKLVADESRSSANDSLTKENDESGFKESNELKPHDIYYEQISNVCENILHHIDQEVVLNKTDMKKSQTPDENTSEVTEKECGTGDDSESILPLSEMKPSVKISTYGLVTNSEAENDNIGSILNYRDIQIIEDSNKSEQELLNPLSHQTEQVILESDENLQISHVEGCHVQEKYVIPEEKKIEKDIVVIKTKSDYKNSMKCSHGGSKIAVVSPLQTLENKLSDNIILDTDNTSISHESNDCFQGVCHTVLNIMTPNRQKFIQEGDKQNNEKCNDYSEIGKRECKDYLDSTIVPEQAKIISCSKNKSDTYSNDTSGSSDVLTTDKYNQLEIQEELLQNKTSLKCQTHAECEEESNHKNIKACHFNSEKNVVSSVIKNKGICRLEDLMKEETSDQSKVEYNSKCNIACEFSGLQKKNEENIETFINTDEEEHSVSNLVNHQNFETNKIQIEDNCQSNIEHSQNLHDVEIETNNEFISTDFIHSESDSVCNDFETEINSSKLHDENKNVSPDTDVITKTEKSVIKCIEVIEAKPEDTVIIHEETDVILCVSNGIKENNERNETHDVYSNTANALNTNKSCFSNETVYNHLNTTSNPSKSIQRDENKIKVFSIVDNSQFVAEKSVLEDLNMNESATKKDHKEYEILVKETTDSEMKSEILSQKTNNLLNVSNSLRQINESDSREKCNGDYTCILNKSVLEDKLQRNLDCQLLSSSNYCRSEIKIFEAMHNPSANEGAEMELSTNSGKKPENITSSENSIISANSSETIYKNVCDHTLVNLPPGTLTSNENRTSDAIQYDSVCHKPDIDKRAIPYFESTCDNENVFAFEQNKHSDLKTQDDSNFGSNDDEKKRHDNLETHTVKQTPDISGINCPDDEVMDLSCNLTKHNWNNYPNFEIVHHKESKNIDCDIETKHVSLDCTSCSDRIHHEHSVETDLKGQKHSPDKVFSYDDNSIPPETERKDVNVDISVHDNLTNNSNNTDYLERVYLKNKCKREYLKIDSVFENKSTDSQVMNNRKDIHKIDKLKDETVALSSFCINKELKCTPNKFTNKYHNSDSALIKEHSFEECNENNIKTCRIHLESQNSINHEKLLPVEEPSDFNNMNNNNIISSENFSEKRTDKSHLLDDNLPEETYNSVQESSVNIKGIININSKDNYEFEASKNDSESKQDEKLLYIKSAQSKPLANKTCGINENYNILDKDSFDSGSKDDIQIYQRILSPQNVENYLEYPLPNTQNKNVSTSERNCVASPHAMSTLQVVHLPVREQEGDKSDEESKVRSLSINRSQLENTSMLSDSSEEVIDEDKTEISFNVNEVDADTRNAPMVISSQNCSDLDISTSICSATIENKSLYINQNEHYNINDISQNSNEKICVEDNLLENIDRVRNSLTLSGNNNFEKLLDPYEFQSSLYNDVSVKSEILSNITNIPSKESCPLQCLVEAALALETAVVNKISLENTDGIQNSEHIIKRRNFYCDNSLNEDSKSIVTGNSITKTVQKSLDISFGSNYEGAHINSQLHQTRNEEGNCGTDLNLDDMNVSSDEHYPKKSQRRRSIKQKEKRKTNKKYKMNSTSQLKHSHSATVVTENNNDTLVKDQCVEFSYENSKDRDIDIKSPCNSDNVYNKKYCADIQDECQEECMAPSVPLEDNKITHETVCLTDGNGDTEYSQKDFIVPDQSVVCFQVTSDKMDEYMNQISNLPDVELITENAENNKVSETNSLTNKSCIDGYPQIPGVDLENETSLVIIIEEIANISEGISNKKEKKFGESIEHGDNRNSKLSVEEKEGSSSADFFLLTAKKENGSTCTSPYNGSTDNNHLPLIHKSIQDEESLCSRNIKNLFDNSEQQKLDIWCETSESYEHINGNLVNGISNWPFLEEEIALEQNNSYQNIESKKQPYHLKCSLPWERIFNISNSRKRKTSRSKQETNVGLELGPAKVEVRLGTESGVWKVINNSPNDCSSPVVKVKRLILQRDPDLTSSYSEKESEEENDVKEKRKNSLSQSSDDSLPKVIIKKKSTSEYTSYLRLSDDEKWQPVVMLTRSKELDELILKEKHVVSSPCDKNTLDMNENISHERHSLDIFNYSSENEISEEIQINSPTESKILPEISNYVFKNAVKKRPLKRRFKFGKTKERKFNKGNYFCSNILSIEKRVFSDDESSGSNKESDYSPTCPVDASQEFAWQCIEKSGEEFCEIDNKDLVTDCIISQNDKTTTNEDSKNIMNVASTENFSDLPGRNSSEIISEEIVSIEHTVYSATENRKSSDSNDNNIDLQIVDNDSTSIKNCDTGLNHFIATSTNDINEEVKLCNLTVFDEINKDRNPKENDVDIIETLGKSISDYDSLSQKHQELENEASKNEIGEKQSCSISSESDNQLLGSLSDICVQSTQCNNPLLKKSVRDIIVEKPSSVNRDRGLKRPSEGHSKEDTKRRRFNIKQYALECHKCHIGFEDKVIF